jgi:hypothetical protein
MRSCCCVCVRVSAPIIARQRLGRNVTAVNEYTRNNRKIVGRLVSYAVRVVSGKVGDWFFPELLVIKTTESGMV